MNECWADPLGDCRGKISQEHTVSEGMLAETIAVEGFKWCKPEPKEIRRKKLTRPILCEGHNNELSFSVDPAGVTFMDTFRAFWLLDQAREAMSSRRWTIERRKINGLYLEQWFLKTLINTALDGNHKIGSDSDREGKPSARLVKAAFGREPFRGRAGLYGLGYATQKVTIEDKVRIMTLIGHQSVLVGAVFSVHGYRFAIFLDESGLAPNPYLPLFPEEGLLSRQHDAVYHIRELRFTVGGYLSHVVEFQW